jgi:hypothetical protein
VPGAVPGAGSSVRSVGVAGPGWVAVCEEVAVPAQHRVRACQQSEPTKRFCW